jgi:hypothetical protein
MISFRLHSKPQSSSGRRLHDPLLLLFVLIPVTSVLSFLSLGSEIGRPFEQILRSRDTLSPRLFVADNTPIWWVPLADGLLHSNDELLSINGASYVQSNNVIEAAWERGERTVSVLVRRSDGTRLINLPLALFSWTHLVDTRLPITILSIGAYVLAIVVYRARSTDHLNRLIVLCALAFALSNGTDHATIQWSLPVIVAQDLTGKFGVMIQFALFVQIALYVTQLGKKHFARVMMMAHVKDKCKQRVLQ